MPVEVEILGGTMEHGRSCYYVHDEKYQLMMDCGINNQLKTYPKFEGLKTKRLDYLFISHIHKDHVGAIARMLEGGIEIGTCLLTGTTLKQMKKSYPLTYKNIVERCVCLEEAYAKERWHVLGHGLEFIYGYSGHMHGAVWYALRLQGKIIFYSADYSAKCRLLSFDPVGNTLGKEKIDFGLIDAANGTKILDYDLMIKRIMEIVDSVWKEQQALYVCGPVYGKTIEILIQLLRKYQGYPFYLSREIRSELLDFCEKNTWVTQAISKSQIFEFKEENVKKTGIHFPGGIEEATYKVQKWTQNKKNDVSKKGYKDIGIDIDISIRASTYRSKESYDKEGYLLLLTVNPWKALKENDRDFWKDYVHSIYKENMLSHQDFEGICELYESLKMRKSTLCHCNTKKALEVQTELHKRGFTGITTLEPGETIYL